jgi:hypothetical protein
VWCRHGEADSNKCCTWPFSDYLHPLAIDYCCITPLQWWGARIIRQAPPQQGVPMGPCYVIAYDSDEGFEAEERTIRIMSQREARGAGSLWSC